MLHNVLVTGAGKAAGLGFNLVLRYLKQEARSAQR